MPVDKTISDAMLGTFRTMLQECEDKYGHNDAVKELSAILSRMEALATESDDVAVFSGKLTQENLFIRFSEQYGTCLAVQQQAPAAVVYDEKQDALLVTQTLNAYRDAASRLRAAKAEVQSGGVIGSEAAVLLFQEQKTDEAFNRIIKLGESGVSYPQLLTELIKGGLDKALEAAVTDRQSLQFSLDAAVATASNPYSIQTAEEKIKLFDSLGADAPFNVPDSLLFQLGSEKIEWHYRPLVFKWNKIKEGWQRSLYWLDEWITSWCSFAPVTEPWSAAANPAAAVKQSQDCVPGMLRVWEKINERYFGLKIPGLFSHESFHWDMQYNHLLFSDEYCRFLIEEVEPVCTPFTAAPASLIEVAEKMHHENRKPNPGRHLPAQRFATFYDSYFGEGQYAKRYGAGV